MRINQTQNQQVNKVHLDKLKKLNCRYYEKRTDQVTISSKALNIKGLKLELKKLPEVREEKVQMLKEQIQHGTYEVSSRAIVQKLMQDLAKE